MENPYKERNPIINYKKVSEDHFYYCE